MFSDNASKILREFCKRYKKIALANMMHDITFGHGQISMLISDKNVFSYYAQQQIPTLCTDETGRTLDSGIYVNKIMESEYQDCAILMPLLVRIGKQFNQNFGQSSLEIVVRENDCQHLYSLFFDLPEKEFLHWVINNGHIIDDLMASYQDAASDVILEAKSPDNRIVLPSFNSHANKDVKDAKLISVIHKTLNTPIFLTSRQSQCLHLLMQGKPIKRIAQEMELSPRTVEHYLERIRRLLGCRTNKEMIVSYFGQI